MRERTKTVQCQPRGKEIAQGQCTMMTLEDRCKHRNCDRKRLPSTRGKAFTIKTANLTLGRVGERKGTRRSRICKEEGIALGQQGKDYLRDMNRISLQHEAEGGKQYLVKISDSWLEMRQLGTTNMGTSPKHLHHPQVPPNATGYSSALPEQLFTLKHCTVHCGGSATDWQIVQLGTGTSSIFSHCTQSTSSSWWGKCNEHQEKYPHKDKKRR